MRGEPPLMQAATTPPSIRGLAVRSAVAIGGLAVVLSLLWDGRSLKSSLVLGIVVAIGGLAAWIAYHVASRQDNGLVIIGFDFAAALSAPDGVLRHSLGYLIIRQLVGTVPTALLIGLAIHALDARKLRRRAEASPDRPSAL